MKPNFFTDDRLIWNIEWRTQEWQLISPFTTVYLDNVPIETINDPSNIRERFGRLTIEYPDTLAEGAALVVHTFSKWGESSKSFNIVLRKSNCNEIELEYCRLESVNTVPLNYTDNGLRLTIIYRRKNA